ncbi:hypothetical protein Leryth_021210 [Lithospermum erythrorhizon]|nr:hypothetical protein Leryth_021210 [Lithospermum erythrorhizon]
MGSIQVEFPIRNEENNFLQAMQLPGSAVLCLVLKAVIELDLFEIMAKAGPNAQISASEIVTSLPTSNPEASLVLDRMLRFLASYSILKCSVVVDEEGNDKRLYSLTPICSNYIRNEDGFAIAPYLLAQFDKVFMQAWYQLKDSILEGGTPFNREYGMHAFEYPGKDSRFNDVFNKGLQNLTGVTMKIILEVYKGFDGIEEVIDVGGGYGASLAWIVSKYPKIRGINFDLPHVIKDAPAIQGVEHVEGNMFESVPKVKTIFIKLILHDWDDDHCIRLLKNCFEALPNCGKVILVESILPESPQSDCVSNISFYFDIMMMTYNPGGRERTLKQFEALAKSAGFSAIKPIRQAYFYWVIEVYKN